MNKFVSVFCALFFLSLASPAFAAYASMDEGWSGIFPQSKVQRLSNGTYQMTDASRGGPRIYADCKRFSDGHAGAGTYCRGDISDDGGVAVVQTPAAQDTPVAQPNSNHGKTLYAVFHPQFYQRYVPQGRGNIWNLDMVPSMRQACANAGGNCMLMEASEGNWQQARDAVKAATGWPL